MKGSSVPNKRSTKPAKIGVSKPTGKAPIHGKLAKMYHASKGKTMLKATTPSTGSQY